MSIDKSLRRKDTLQRQRSVLTRAERIKVLMDEERWKAEQSPFGLPKVRVQKIVIKKAKKAKEEAKPEGEAAAAAGAPGAPAAAGAAPAADAKKGAEPKKAAGKKEEKKK